MNNEEIVEKRFKLSNDLLKKSLNQFKSIYSDIYHEITLLFKIIKVSPTDLNSRVDASTKRYYQKKVQEWKKLGLLIGYFGFAVKSLKKLTYSNVLEILVLGIFMEKYQDHLDISYKAFRKIADNAYKQAVEESPTPIPFYVIPLVELEKMLFIPTVNKTFKEYIELLMRINAQDVFRYLNNCLMQGIIFIEDELLKLLNKLMRKVVNVNITPKGETKFSGVLDDMFTTLINKVYLYPFRKDKDKKVRFVAVIDKRTTKMCESLNTQEFYVNRENKFYRYSDLKGGMVLTEVFGLVTGVNLPPISDHYHHCRSTIVYI